jgi:hypothetical protein
MVFPVEMAEATSRLRDLGRACSQPQEPAISISPGVGRLLVLNIETMTSSVDLPKRSELESAVKKLD